jgi:hypothetical protein
MSVIAVQSPEDVVNLALTRVGHPFRVVNIMDGSPQSVVALNIYAQTRDELLRQKNWDFAKVIVTASTTGYTAPAPWTYEYTYPDNCLKLRQLFNANYLASMNNPIPTFFTIGQNATLGQKVIWSTTGFATLVYTQQVVNPTEWEADFTELLAASIGKRLAPILQKLEMVKVEESDEKAALLVAESVIG